MLLLWQCGRVPASPAAFQAKRHFHSWGVTGCPRRGGGGRRASFIGLAVDRGRLPPTRLIGRCNLSVKAGMKDPIVEHRELLEEFFLEAFPNPERVGCPDEDAMQALAENGPVSKRSCAAACGFLLGVLQGIWSLASRTFRAKSEAIVLKAELGESLCADAMYVGVTNKSWRNTSVRSRTRLSCRCRTRTTT